MKHDGRIVAWVAAPLVGAIIAAGTLVAPSAAQSANGSDSHKLKIQSVAPGLAFAPVLAMLIKHYDAAHGIQVEITGGGTSATLPVDAVLSRQADLAWTGANTALQAARQGAPIMIVSPVANNTLVMIINNNTMKKIGVRATAPIADRIHALKGLTIATNPPGGSFFAIVQTWLSQYGLNPDKDVKRVGVNSVAAMISGLQQGRYDAIASGIGTIEPAITLGAGTLWVSAPRGDVSGSESAITSVLIARADTVVQRHANIDALRAAMADAIATIRQDPAAMGSALHETYFPKLDPAIWNLTWGNARGMYPARLVFPKAAADYWIRVDPKGAASYSNIDYRKLVYGPAQG